MPRYLSDENLEAIAARVLRAYLELPEVQNRSLINIDPVILVNKLLGLKLEYQRLSRDDRILGLTSFEELLVQLPEQKDKWFQLDGKTVLVEKDLRDDPNQYGRRNFTITHEGGHHILKMLFPRNYGPGINARSVLYYREGAKSDRSREEQQVNTLTSFILMPEFLIKQGMKLVGLEEKIEVLNRLWCREEYDKFCGVARLLGVSKQALSIRMKQLGLIGRDYLTNPREMMDIFMEEDFELYD